MMGSAKIGSKPIAIITLVVSCLVVAAGFSWQQNFISDQSQNQHTQQQQQIAEMIHQAVSSRIALLRQQMESVATSLTLATVIMSEDAEVISAKQVMLTTLFPNAQKVCLFSADVDQADASACLPITFASLNSLRVAKEKGSAPMALMQIGKENAYLLLAHRIMNNREQVVGVLMVALNPDVVTNLLFKEYGANGYVELRQGVKKTSVIVRQGDSKWKQDHVPTFDKKLANSYWRISYWAGESVRTASAFMMILATMLGALVSMWFLREMWQHYLFKRDVATLRQQIVDIKERKLKLKYPLAHDVLQAVVDDFRTWAIDVVPPPKEAIKPKPVLQTVQQEVEQKIENQPADRPSVEAIPLEFKIESSIVEIVGSDQDVEPAQSEEIDPSIFKAYDIRGVVAQTFNEHVVTKLGRAIGSEAKEQGQNRLVVGCDGRHSSPSLTAALIEGVLASGCDVIDIGMVPTPVLYFACQHFETYSGVIVTGSHNPADYNGLKIVLADKSLAGDDIQALYQRIKQENFTIGHGTKNSANVIDDYIKRIVGDVHIARSIKVVVDCGNGAAGVVAPKLLTALGCEVIELYCDVDGDFPNHHPDPSQLENLSDLIKAVQHAGAELGIAFDGDGDRLGVVDINGKAIWADRLMTLFAQDVLSRQAGATIIYDVKSTNLLGDTIKQAGGEGLMWKSGHSIIKNKMQETGAQLAGEMSGHIFFKERWFGFDDGLYAASRLLELLASDSLERTPTEVFAAIPDRINTPEIIIEMDDGESRNLIEKLSADPQFDGATIITIDGVRAEYPNGWGLVRASNTMPGITLRFEASTEEDLQQIQQQFKQQILQINPTLTLRF